MLYFGLTLHILVNGFRLIVLKVFITFLGVFYLLLIAKTTQTQGMSFCLPCMSYPWKVKRTDTWHHIKKLTIIIVCIQKQYHFNNLCFLTSSLSQKIVSLQSARRVLESQKYIKITYNYKLSSISYCKSFLMCLVKTESSA